MQIGMFQEQAGSMFLTDTNPKKGNSIYNSLPNAHPKNPGYLIGL